MTAEVDDTIDLDAFAAEHAGLFRLAEARRAGWSGRVLQRKLDQGRVDRVHEGVYRFRGAPISWRSAALAAAWAGGELSGLSHRSAAKVYGFAEARSKPIEILCKRWDRAQHDGLHVHEFSGLVAGDLTVLAGLPVVQCELSLLQIAGYRWADVDLVERAIHSARRRNLVTNASLEEYLYRRARRGRPGVRKLRAAVMRSREHKRPTESEMETLLLQTLRRHGFPEPVLQFEVRDGDGRLVARADAALTDWDILLEYDSALHHSVETEIARDNKRRLWANKYGYVMIPVRHADLRDGGHDLAAAIRGVIARDRSQPA